MQLVDFNLATDFSVSSENGEVFIDIYFIEDRSIAFKIKGLDPDYIDLISNYLYFILNERDLPYEDRILDLDDLPKNVLNLKEKFSDSNPFKLTLNLI